jgi:hypothetical protein
VYPFDTTISAGGGGPLAYLGQTSYGWNGTTWVAGNTNSKTTHASVDAFDEGLTISFVDGQTGTSFGQTEFYNFAVCEGELKDNATTNTLEDSFYYKKSYVNATDINVATIPAPTAGATGLVGIDTLRSNSLDTSLDGSNNTVFHDQNGMQFSVGNIELIGDFSITYGYNHTNPLMDVTIGIGSAGAGVINQNQQIACIQFGFSIQQSTNIIYALYLLSDGVTFGSQNLGSVSSVTSLGINRVGTAIQFVVNGSPVTINQQMMAVGLGKTRFQTICSPNDWPQIANQVANRVAPAVTVVSNGQDNAIVAGNGTSTGYFNPLFIGIDTDARGGISAMIGGSPVTNIHVDGTAPAAGEVTVDPFMGTFVFNAADQGKSFSAVYTYLTHE